MIGEVLSGLADNADITHTVVSQAQSMGDTTTSACQFHFILDWLLQLNGQRWMPFIEIHLMLACELQASKGSDVCSTKRIFDVITCWTLPEGPFHYCTNYCV